MVSFDLIVLGGGPGGYVAALRAAQLGLKVCLVEKEFLGGVCLNRGCIPSKTLLAGTELFGKIKKCDEWGIEIPGPPSWNLKRLFDRKDEVISKMRQGLDLLCQKRKVFRAHGAGRMVSPTQVRVGSETYSANKVIIATGSAPKQVDFGLADKTKVWSSVEALSPERLPQSLLILGGGPEGCEFALIYKGLGVNVTVVEAKERLLPGFDRDASAAMKRALTAKGIGVYTGEILLRVRDGDGNVMADLDKSARTLAASVLLTCVGRTPLTNDLGLEPLGVRLNEKKAVITNSALKTNLDPIYAIGDVLGNHMMAHSASYEGYVTAGLIAGKKETLDYRAVPSCVYTYPEVAEVGLNEEKAAGQNIPYEIGRFSFMALGRSHAKGETEGFVKMIGHAKTGEVLGGVIVGAGASELVNVLSLAIKNKLKVSDLRTHIAPHPSASEAVVEAAHLFFKEGLHAG